MTNKIVLGTLIIGSLLSLILGYFFLALTLMVLLGSSMFFFSPGVTKKINPEKKAVFITGCDSGFGNNLARRLDKHGFQVFAGCLFVDKGGALELKKECSDNLHVIPLDVTDDWQVRGAVKYVKEHIGDNVLWAIVNNAGIGLFTEIEWCSVLQFQRIMDVNVFGVVRVTKAFLPLVRQVQGRIINVASLAGRFTLPAFAAYSMSKKACIAFSDALRIEMMKFNVNVVTIEPGLYKTPISSQSYLEEQTRKSWSETPTEIKDAYGEEYFDAFVDNIGEQMKRARSNVDEVVDLMELAVTEVTPRVRYVPSTSYVRATILTYLPSKITDKLFQSYTPKSRPRQSTSSVSSSVSSASDNDVSHS